MDETSWKERTTLLWLWVFTTRTTVVFWIASRSSELLDNVLGDDWNGWLMSDGYSAYRQFSNGAVAGRICYAKHKAWRNV